MKTIDVILIIISILILLGLVIFIIYKHFNYKVSSVIFRINDAQSSLTDKINKKSSLIVDMINYVNDKFKVRSKNFETVMLNLKKENTFDDDRLYNKCYEEILKIYEDNIKSKDVKKLKNDMKKYEENELHIISLRTYYNKYTLVYNNIIKRFPYFIISNFKKYKLKVLFEGEELDLDKESFMEV